MTEKRKKNMQYNILYIVHIKSHNQLESRSRQINELEKISIIENLYHT